MTRAAMWTLLTVVALSAAVLSFSSLRDLAVQCGYPTSLAPLFPLTVDCGAAAACLTWLGGESAATTVGRTLTWTLLVASVGMNGITHYVDAYDLRPAWWLIVGVSAIPPATLGACVHLAVLLGRVSMSDTDRQMSDTSGHEPAPSPVEAVPVPKRTIVARESDKTSAETLARALVAENPGIGRRALSQRSGVSEHVARTLLAEKAAPRNGAKVLEEAK